MTQTSHKSSNALQTPACGNPARRRSIIVRNDGLNGRHSYGWTLRQVLHSRVVLSSIHRLVLRASVTNASLRLKVVAISALTIVHPP